MLEMLDSPVPDFSSNIFFNAPIEVNGLKSRPHSRKCLKNFWCISLNWAGQNGEFALLRNYFHRNMWCWCTPKCRLRLRTIQSSEGSLEVQGSCISVI